MSSESQSLQPCGMEANQSFFILSILNNIQQPRAFKPTLANSLVTTEHRWQKGEAKPTAGCGTDQRWKGHTRNTSESPDRAASSSSIHDERRYLECHKLHYLVAGTSMISRNQTQNTPVGIRKASDTTDTHMRSCCSLLLP